MLSRPKIRRVRGFHNCARHVRITDLKTDVRELKDDVGDLKVSVPSLRGEMRTSIARLRDEMHKSIADSSLATRAAIAEVSTKIQKSAFVTRVWMFGLVAIVLGVMAHALKWF
jgi:hypothetical protein